MDPRALSYGARSSNKGVRGVSKRLNALASLTPLSGGRLLDVGCADGSYTLVMAEHFETVDAIDIEPARLDDLRAKLEQRGGAATPVTVAQMSADDLQFPDGCFDVVTAIEVLEHVADLDRTLQEVHRVLAPGGRFLVTSPNRWFPFETHGPVVAGARRPTWAFPFLPWIPPLHRRWSDARAFTVTGLARQAQQHQLPVTGKTYIMPPFDRSRVGRKIRPLTEAVERSRLNFFGMALVMVFTKDA